MKENKTEYPFPDTPEDGDVMFRGEIVCQYHSATNTWECWRFYREDRI
jgi:hypothetical protein